MGQIGLLVGAFVITYLISRLALYLLSKTGVVGTTKLVVAHGGTLALSWVLSAFGSADGGPPNWGAGMLYAVPVVVWFIVDIVRGRRGAPEKTAA